MPNSNGSADHDGSPTMRAAGRVVRLHFDGDASDVTVSRNYCKPETLDLVLLPTKKPHHVWTQTACGLNANGYKRTSR